MRIRPIFLVLLLFPAIAVADEIPEMTPGETSTAHALMTSTEMVHRLVARNMACPFEDRLLHDMDELQALLDPEDRPAVIVQDGWTTPFQVWCEEENWAIVSYGADRIPGANYAAFLPELPEYGDDFVVLNGELVGGPAHVLTLMEMGKQKRTMADLRSIATVFEAFRIDNDAWPGVPVEAMTPVVGIEVAVQPIYIRSLPLRDAWGHSFVYWHDGESYRIVSPGKDGVFESDYTITAGLGELDEDNPDRDIVFANGQFEQWPTF